jgi:hypothetical protein
MENQKIIAAFEKNSKEEVQVLLTEIKGHRVGEIRIIGKNDKKPSGQVSFTLDLLPKLRQAILDLEDAVNGSKM